MPPWQDPGGVLRINKCRVRSTAWQMVCVNKHQFSYTAGALSEILEAVENTDFNFLSCW